MLCIREFSGVRRIPLQAAGFTGGEFGQSVSAAAGLPSSLLRFARRTPKKVRAYLLIGIFCAYGQKFTGVTGCLERYSGKRNMYFSVSGLPE
jgi:hypothetical protein